MTAHPHQAKSKNYSRIPLVREASAIIAELEDVAGEPGTWTLCHHDLLPDNLILSPEGNVSVIDFEYSGAGQPLLDLAIFAMGCGFDAEAESKLLMSYLESESLDPALIRTFGSLKVLAALRETMWGVTAEASGVSALSEAEAIAYTDSNYAFFNKSMADWRTSLEQ